MNHQAMKDKLSEFYDGELAANEREAVQSHVALCPECSAQIQSWKMLSEKVFNHPAPKPSEFFVNQVMQRIETLENKKKPQRIVPIQWFAPVLGMAAMLLLAIMPTGEAFSMDALLIGGDLDASAQLMTSGTTPKTEDVLNIVMEET